MSSSQQANQPIIPPISSTRGDDELVPESTDERHLRRARLVQALFAHSFGQTWNELEPEEVTLVNELIAELPSLDAMITEHAPERPLSEVNKVDLAILRLVVFESTRSKTPKKVLIDEAVELAKEFGSETSSKFVNGVLGTLLMSDSE